MKNLTGIGHALMLFVFAFAQGAASGAEKTYEEQLAGARRFADEKSWALARDAYAEAMKVAPDDEARRWCELWQAQAEWRAADSLWQVKSEIEKKLGMLLSSYQSGPGQQPRPRDSFWARATDFFAKVKAGYSGGDDSWAMWREVLAYWLEQPPSVEAGRELINFLHGLEFERIGSSRNEAQNFGEALASVSKKGATLAADERAWCALHAAWLRRQVEYGSQRKAMNAGLWQEAAIACRGTQYEPIAEACLLHAQAVSDEPDAVSKGMTANRELWGGGLGAVLARACELGEQLKRAPRISIAKYASENISKLIVRWKEPFINVDVNDEMRPDDALEFAVSATLCGEMAAELYEFSAEEYEAWGALEKRVSLRAGGAAVREEFLRVSGARLVQSLVLFEDAKVDDFLFHTGLFRFPPLGKGFYLLVVKGRDAGGTERVTMSQVVVSEAKALALAPSHGDMQLYVLNRADNAPLANASVNFAWLERKDNARRAASPKSMNAPAASGRWSGTSDANGRVLAPMPGAGELVGFVDGQPLLMGVSRPYEYRWKDEQLMMDLFLDRSLYRPGETVRWKLVARERKEGRFGVFGGKAALSVAIDDEKLLDKTPVKFNAFGTAHGEFVIPAAVRPGEATCEVSVGDSEEEISRAFWVDNYLPAAMRTTVELASGPESVRPGGEVAVRIKAEYFSGGPAAGVPVECRFSVHPAWGMNGFQRDLETLKKYTERVRELTNREPQRAMTDLNGETVFKLKLHEDWPEGSMLYVVGKAHPEGMPDTAVRGMYSISKAGYFVDYPMLQYPRLVEPGAESVFTLDISDATGKACVFEGEAYFYERRWVEVWLDPEGRRVSGSSLESARVLEKRALDDDLPLNSETLARLEYTMPEGWTKLFADYVTVPVGEPLPVSCGADGRLKMKFLPPREGIFEMRLEKNGRELSQRSESIEWRVLHKARQEVRSSWMNEGQRMIFVAANESTTSLAFNPRNAFVLGLENHRAGEPLRCLVVLPEFCRDAFLSVTGEQRAVSQRITQQNRVGFATLADVPDVSGEMKCQMADFKDGRNIVDLTFPVPDVRRQIALEISPNRAGASPGATDTLAVRARDFSGKPLRTEVVVAVTDNAVNEMAEAYGMKQSEPPFLKYTRAASAQWIIGGKTRKIMERDDERQGAALVVLCGGATRGAGVLPKYVVNASREGEGAGAAMTMQSRLSMNHTRHWEFGKLEKAKDGLSDEVSGIRLRRHFASTAFWEPELVTDKDGRARVNFTYPDNLTQWRIAAYAVGEDGNTFGVAQAMTRTSLPLQARLLAPRFLIEGDTAALPGLFVNRADADLKVSANMKGEGALDLSAAMREVVTPKQGEARALWQARAREPGEAVVTLAARAADVADAADAMQITLPVLEDGIRQDTAASARIEANETRASMALPLPNPLNRERLESEVVIAQGRAAVMLDALPYLIDYPYGCVEQTMSRFLPAVVVKKTLANFGFDADVVEKRILDRETGAARARRERSAGLAKLDDVVAQSLSSLREANQYGAGYGWWPGSGGTDLWMTAYVAWGLQLAKEAGVAISDDWLKAVRDVVRRELREGKSVDDRVAWALFVASEIPTLDFDKDSFAETRKTFARVYAGREKLSASGRACLLAASARWGSDAERTVLLRNLETGVQRTARGVHWGATGGYWRATEGAVESTALSVMALLKVAPEHSLVEPALDWLAMNRRGTGWQNTRASAFAVLALARSVAGTGEEAFVENVDVFLNGKKLRSVSLSRKSLLAGATRVVLPAELLQGGENRIELRRAGPAGKECGVLYVSALASAWARGDSVRAEGNLVSVARGFSGRRIEPTLGGDGRLRATAMAETGVANAGDEVTARVALSVPGELEYLMVAVPKPAGCEPLNPLSGWDAELVRADAAKGAKPPARRSIYREEHDDHSAFFLDHVEAGEWEIRFTMRAVTPGDFRALPVKVEAMYAPEVRANSDARRVRIE